MAGTGSLQHIDNTPFEKTLKKIEQFNRIEKAQRQKQDETRERKEAVNQLTNALLGFSREFLSISRDAIAKLESEECQILCENLLLRARQKRRLPLRICGTVATWASWVAAVVLPPFVMDQAAAFAVSVLLSGMCGCLVALALTTDIWDGTVLSFPRKYNKCLPFTDKPGALIVKHAREEAQKNPQQS